jgi:hypothetical protein
MDQVQIREAMRAITTSVGRKKAGGGVRGVQVEKLRERLVAALLAGERTTGKGAGNVYNAATTVKMAARLLAVGGTVPECVAARFSFGACIPGLRAMAAGMGVDADALIGALVRSEDIAAAQAAQVVAEADAAAFAAVATPVDPVVEPEVVAAPEAAGAEVVQGMRLVQQPDVTQAPRRNGTRRR